MGLSDLVPIIPGLRIDKTGYIEYQDATEWVRIPVPASVITLLLSGAKSKVNPAGAGGYFSNPQPRVTEQDLADKINAIDNHLKKLLSEGR